MSQRGEFKLDRCGSINNRTAFRQMMEQQRRQAVYLSQPDHPGPVVHPPRLTDDFPILGGIALRAGTGRDQGIHSTLPETLPGRHRYNLLDSQLPRCARQRSREGYLFDPPCSFASERLSLSTNLTVDRQTAQLPIAVRVGADNADRELHAETFLVVGSAARVATPSGKLDATVTDRFAVLENKHLRLSFRRNEFGFGPAELSVCRGDGRQATIAWLPKEQSASHRD